MAAIELDSIGRARLGLEQYQLAEVAFRQSFERTGNSLRRLVATLAARRDFVAADEHARRLDPELPFSYIEQTSLAVDRGQWTQARAVARQGLAVAETYGGSAARYMHVPVAVTGWLTRDIASGRAQLRDAVAASTRALSEPASPDAEDDAATVLASALVALRLGDDDMAATGLAVALKHADLMRVPYVQELASVVKAERARRAGRPREAIGMLLPYLRGQERYQTRVALMEAYADAGDHARALAHAAWLQEHRGRAYIDSACGHCLQALNAADSTTAILREAELHTRLGQARQAAAALARFDRQWPPSLLPPQLRKRREALGPVSS
jgi:hypothetical protein